MKQRQDASTFRRALWACAMVAMLIIPAADASAWEITKVRGTEQALIGIDENGHLRVLCSKPVDEASSDDGVEAGTKRWRGRWFRKRAAQSAELTQKVMDYLALDYAMCIQQHSASDEEAAQAIKAERRTARAAVFRDVLGVGDMTGEGEDSELRQELERDLQEFEAELAGQRAALHVTKMEVQGAREDILRLVDLLQQLRAEHNAFKEEAKRELDAMRLRQCDLEQMLLAMWSQQQGREFQSQKTCEQP